MSIGVCLGSPNLSYLDETEAFTDINFKNVEFCARLRATYRHQQGGRNPGAAVVVVVLEKFT